MITALMLFIYHLKEDKKTFYNIKYLIEKFRMLCKKRIKKQQSRGWNKNPVRIKKKKKRIKGGSYWGKWWEEMTKDLGREAKHKIWQQPSR